MDETNLEFKEKCVNKLGPCKFYDVDEQIKHRVIISVK